MFKRIVTSLNHLTKSRCNAFSTTSRICGIYEPDYLDALKPKHPIYETINFQIKGYDYAIIENYQKFLHRIAAAMELDVSDCWASPPQLYDIQRMKPASSVVESTYQLTVYERTVQISDIGAPIYPIFLRIVQSALPEGVSLEVVEHTELHEDIRYVPDKELLDCKKLLDELGGPIEKKKR